MASFLGELGAAMGKTAAQVAKQRMAQDEQMEREQRAQMLREKWYNKERADRLDDEKRSNEEWDRRFTKQQESALEIAKAKTGTDAGSERVETLRKRINDLDKEMETQLEQTKVDSFDLDPSAVEAKYNKIKNDFDMRKYRLMGEFGEETIQRAGFAGYYNDMGEMVQGLNSGQFIIDSNTGRIVPKPDEPEPTETQEPPGFLSQMGTALGQDIKRGYQNSKGFQYNTTPSSVHNRAF